ncbi:hypothetical protein IFM89_002499 [Coptis chinensis]|uniref:Uncharacterized protein n=1 Tax=Coptis chinensis TaxID=261450 RepID=A0A835LUJ5_9MAGN|nr:hypothetical protein IFM89_002499 [Coptis chinensis]
MNKPTSTKTFFTSPHTLTIHKTPSLPLPSTSNHISFKTLCSQSPTPTPISSLTLNSILRIIPDWADGIKERRMQQKRSLYNHEDWVQHRSSLRHLRHLLSSFSSRVILSLIPPVIAFTSFAAVIATYNSAVLWHWLPDSFLLLRTSSLPYQLTAPALALLLVFRTEASYSRFEEGRKAWTKLIAGTSDFARQVIGSVDTQNHAVLKKALLQYIMAFPVALKCHVIYGADIAQDLKDLLEEDDLAIVLDSKDRPRCIIEFISQSLQMLPLEDSKRDLLESKFTCFHEGIAICEQLIGIPIPLSYTRLTSSAASLFCIEEVGVLIEEPFPMLALDAICNQVNNSIQEAVTLEAAIKGQLLAKQKSPADEHSSNGRLNS